MQIFRRILLTLALVALAVTLIIAALYAEENWRGARAWAAVRRGLQARGEPLTWPQVIPPPIPDDQNLALADPFARAFQYRVDPSTGLLTFHHAGNSHAVQVADDIPYGPNPGQTFPGWMTTSWRTGHPLDLARIQQHYRGRQDFSHAPAPQAPADDVLLALTRYAPLLDELARSAAARPAARFPVNWTQRPFATLMLPHYNLVQNFVSALRLRACASLARGDGAAALPDVLLSFRLCRAIAPEPLLIENLVEAACLEMLLQAVWEGAGSRRWSAAQLVALQAALREVDLLGGYQRSLRTERLIFMSIVEDKTGRGAVFANLLQGITATNDRPLDFGLRAMVYLIPAGWYDLAVADAAELQQRTCIDAIHPARHRMDALKLDQAAAYVSRLKEGPRTFITKFFLPVHTTSSRSVARAQSSVDQALVACALERYQLDHHAYPASLSELVPVYLAQVPVDVIDGVSLRYQRNTAGRYQLWSVGWNQRDDGGVVAWLPNGSKDDYTRGDWVWQYEPIQPPATHPAK